jgi:hypothetical protein
MTEEIATIPEQMACLVVENLLRKLGVVFEKWRERSE